MTREQVLTLLMQLTPTQLAEVLSCYGMPKQSVIHSLQSQLAAKMIEFAEQQNDLARLSATIATIAPHLHSQTSRTPISHKEHFDHIKPALPPGFVGRNAEIRQLNQWLEDGSSALIEGDFRIGKTSLLHTWAQQISGRHVWVLNGQDQSATSPAALVKTITGETVDDNPDHAADILKQWAVAQMLPPLLLFDEAPAFVRNFPLRFFERLRGMLAHVVMVFASPRDLDELYQEQNDTSPLTNCLRYMRLGLLEAEAAHELAVRSRDPDLLLHWAGYHPFYLQLMGVYLASAREDVLEMFCDEAGRHLNVTWHMLSNRERKILCAINCGEMVENTRRLRLRGLLNSDNSLFGEVLRVFLDELCKHKTLASNGG